VTETDLQQLVTGAEAIAKAVAPLEPLLVGVGEAVLSAFRNHVQATLPEIEAQWVLDEAQSAALMKPGGMP
jgi:hypothetical protein